MKAKLILLILLGYFVVQAEDIKYPVSSIPEELKKNTDVVVRKDYLWFKIKTKNSATHHVHRVLTILNENGNELARESVFYDKLTRIISLDAYVYNASGKQIKRLKKNEIYDHAMVDGISLFSDDRMKSIDLSQPVYPYTIEVEYEIDYDFLYYIPSGWWSGERISYEQVSYQLIFPKGLEPRYKLYNVDVKPIYENLEKGFQSVTWKFENLKPNNFEPYGPRMEEIVPHIDAAPTTFQYSGYTGSLDTWTSYGKWQLQLNKDRGLLSVATKQKLKELVDGLSTVEQKTKVVYEYLQSRTRYVNIAEGIGGLQPFPASMVEEMGYGDCKALSNYMVAMLSEVGVKGYYTKIMAGENAKSIETDFPSHQTNHIIVSVPNGKDTLWLECTSQTNPFGYQGTFTEDRWAIMITEEGGKLVKTINYKPEQNLQSRQAKVVIDEKGDGRAKIKTVYTGVQYENDNLNWVLSNQESQKKWIERTSDIPNFNINSFSFEEVKDKIPCAIVDVDLTLSSYASVSGKRLFVKPNLMNRVSHFPEKITERKTDVLCKTNSIDLDTITFSIPENLYPEFLPEPIRIISKFGEYEANFKFDAGKVVYTRKLKLWKGRFPKETYNELVDFYKNISKADNTKLVFLNKT